jgi:hypothetical protein
MTKLLILVAAVVAIVWLLRRAMAGPGSRDADPDASSRQDSATPQGELVECAQCAVKLPKAEAYAASGVPPGAGGRFYCSEEHWRLGPRDG